MTCIDFERENTAERYLASTLPAAEREEFERHSFDCGACFARLEKFRRARPAVQAPGPPPAVSSARRRWIPPAIGIAAAVLTAVFVFNRPMPEPVREAAVARKQAVAELARLVPPPYIATTLRGADKHGAAEFREAMRPYSDGNYAAAAVALRPVLERHPDSLDAQYFLAICELLTDDAKGSVPGLQAVIAAGDRSPYGEEAHYYLAHAFLRVGDKSAARAEWKIVAGLKGDYEQPAHDMLKSIR